MVARIVISAYTVCSPLVTVSGLTACLSSENQVGVKLYTKPLREIQKRNEESGMDSISGKITHGLYFRQDIT